MRLCTCRCNSFSRAVCGLHPSFRFQPISRRGTSTNRVHILIVWEVGFDRVPVAENVSVVSAAQRMQAILRSVWSDLVNLGVLCDVIRRSSQLHSTTTVIPVTI